MTCKTCKHREDCDLFLRSGCDTSVGALFDCAEYVFDDEYDKGLEALKTLISHRKFGDIKSQWEREECRKIIEKELKVLKIIKETWKLSFFDEEQMITIDNCYSIIFYDKEKYDLLKEVLL